MLAGAALLPIIPKSNAETLPVFKAIARGALANDSIYFIMTDRFENGDLRNDNAEIPGGVEVNGLDKKDIGYNQQPYWLCKICTEEKILYRFFRAVWSATANLYTII